MPDSPAARAVELLLRSGAADIPHPGGTLHAHLTRVHTRLSDWGARPALRLAGLCHAFYGTDGFATALLPLEHRAELAGVIGPEAEALVHLYASCDRAATYPGLGGPSPVFHDRFTGRGFVPTPRRLRDFAELSAVNELDIARVDPEFRQRWGPDLLVLFTRLRHLLSDRAWTDCREVLGTAG
ncbi:DUF6817 domain-containing protein [Streptomyces abyssomicinicus]|uniref:DUF6817 domain-containing protein n=1 Tax=Streptomyces abyssomicinicus TaxID=574929 RepID=UPI001FE722F7|nr:hypothetical protein [Streptomyces abyssomicinicus]